MGGSFMRFSIWHLPGVASRTLDEGMGCPGARFGIFQEMAWLRSIFRAIVPAASLRFHLGRTAQKANGIP